MLTRYFCLGIGIVYILIGIVGFIPVFYTSPPASAPHLDVTAGYGYLLGLFPINALHDAVHILIGVLGVAAASRLSIAAVYCRTLFVVYGALTIMGFIPSADTTFGLIPIFGNDTWLHAVSALAAAYFGWVASAENVPAHPVMGHSH